MLGTIRKLAKLESTRYTLFTPLVATRVRSDRCVNGSEDGDRFPQLLLLAFPDLISQATATARARARTLARFVAGIEWRRGRSGRSAGFPPSGEGRRSILVGAAAGARRPPSKWPRAELGVEGNPERRSVRAQGCVSFLLVRS